MSASILLLLRFFMVAVLLAFLIGIMLILWREMTRGRERDELAAPPPLILTVEGQPAREFTTPAVIVGRDPSCDLCIDDQTVSGQHARLAYHHNQWWIEDLRSRNGTLLNDEPIDTAIVIIQGDELRLGQVIIGIG